MVLTGHLEHILTLLSVSHHLYVGAMGMEARLPLLRICGYFWVQWKGALQTEIPPHVPLLSPWVREPMLGALWPALTELPV